MSHRSPSKVAPVVTAAAVAERARQTTEKNTQGAKRKKDRTYETEWNKYVTWVNKQRLSNVIPCGPKFLTRENVDLYFSEVVVHRKVVPDTARRVVSALQMYADDDEYTDGSVTFIVESQVVKKALQTHRVMHEQRILNRVVDPHDDLPTDVLTEIETNRICKEAIKWPNWKDMHLSWTTCDQTYLRFDSLSKLTLRHLRLNHKHGPNVRNDDNYGVGYGWLDDKCITYILDAYVHKERNKKKNEVGAWRHMNYLRCCAGSLAMNLFVRLFADNEINFFAPLNPTGSVNKQAFPEWQKQKLIREWNCKNAVSSAFKALYDASGLSWSKKYHIRKNAMEHGSTRGELPSHKLSTMSKHKADKNKLPFYETQLFPRVMRVMCGLQQKSCYFCPRTRVFPFDDLQPMLDTNEDFLELAARLIFPKRSIWIQQRESRTGDKSKCSANF
jgi:hypothetical protein